MTRGYRHIPPTCSWLRWPRLIQPDCLIPVLSTRRVNISRSCDNCITSPSVPPHNLSWYRSHFLPLNHLVRPRCALGPTLRVSCNSLTIPASRSLARCRGTHQLFAQGNLHRRGVTSALLHSFHQTLHFLRPHCAQLLHVGDDLESFVYCTPTICQELPT